MYICKYLSFLLFIKLALLAYLPVYANAVVVDDNPSGHELTGHDHGHGGGVKVDDNPSGHEASGNNNRTKFDDNPSRNDLRNGTTNYNSAMVNRISIGSLFAVAVAVAYQYI
jgi:hypothetical protein